MQADVANRQWLAKGIGWLALITLGFSVAEDALSRQAAAQSVSFYELSSPLGILPGLLFIALMLATWVLVRRTRGSVLAALGGVALSVGVFLGRGSDLMLAAGILVILLGPLLLGLGLRSAGLPRAAWITCLVWWATAGIGTCVWLAARLSVGSDSWSALMDGVAAFSQLVLLLQWVFLGVLGFSLLARKTDTVRPTSAST
jgi:hypothetical protein